MTTASQASDEYVRSCSTCDFVSFGSCENRCQNREYQREEHQDSDRCHGSSDSGGAGRYVIQQGDWRDEQQRKNRGDDQVGCGVYPGDAIEYKVSLRVICPVLLSGCQQLYVSM
jgi:hypothetical protein